jgi:hypothetical protein
VLTSSSTSASRSSGEILRLLILSVAAILTTARYIPGHIHAFYLEYVYYERREDALRGVAPPHRAPGIYSDNVQTGGLGYGTIAPAN